MDGTSPTRMNLHFRRSQLGLALRGVDLLQKKRDALVKEFFGLVHETLDARSQLNVASQQAHMALFLARAFDGPRETDGFSLSVPVISDVQADVENVWGTRVPKVRVEWPRGATINPLAVGGRTLAAQTAFRELCRALVQLANTESRLRRIGEEIKKTARRVNALEQVVVPGIRSQIRFIQQVLDQQEQEDIFRLKRIKGKIVTQRPG
ncbi:MAG TPA: V-type ATP synthase subunit D [Thermodesulfobacteriota bacterium]|nr:V-type ATP synthase subunit D [Thermodesulfobacteriota bacterium]